MADRSSFFIMQLFHEMKQKFPAIPDRIVNDCIRQNFNNKQICESILMVKNRNFSRRQFPSAQVPSMIPASVHDGSVTIGTNDTSATESETGSSRCEDDAGVSSETEETECSDTKVSPNSSAGNQNSTVPPASLPAAPSTLQSNPEDDAEARLKSPVEISDDVHDGTSGFPPSVSQGGCGRGFGGSCCCRHVDMDFLRHYDESGDMVSMVEGVTIQGGGTSASVLPPKGNNVVFDGLGDNDGPSAGQSVANKSVMFPPHVGIRVPGVLPPPSSHMQNPSVQTSLLDLSSPMTSSAFVGSEFEYCNRIPEERSSKGISGPSFGPSGEQTACSDPLSPPFKPPYTNDRNKRDEYTLTEVPLELPHGVEDFLFNVNCRLKTSGVGSHFLEEEDKRRRVDLGGKEQNSASSMVSASSPLAPPLNRRHANPQGLQPTPVFAGHRQFRSSKESPSSPGRPVSPTDCASAAATPSSPHLIETPLSYTSVNLTVRQPSSDPLPPIDIRSSVGDSSVYASSSCFPKQSFQSELQIRIGGSAGIPSGSGYAPLSPSWKSQQPTPKSPASNQSSPVTQKSPHDPIPIVPESRSSGIQHPSPHPVRRESLERPRSLYELSSLVGMGRTQAQASGSWPDVSKTHSFARDHEKVIGVGSQNFVSHYQPDVKNRPTSSVPSSPASGLPPPGPSSSVSSPKDMCRLPSNATSPPSDVHSQSACSDVSRCKGDVLDQGKRESTTTASYGKIKKALIMHQLERKNLLERKLNCEREKLKSMQEQTRVMEEDLKLRQMQQRRHATLPIIQKVHALRQEIQILQEECKKMTQEVDLNSDIQVPLGETDEEFYKNIYTGQHGIFMCRPSTQRHSPQMPESFHEQSREQQRGRGRENLVPPAREASIGSEGVQRQGDAIGSTGLGPSTPGEGPNWMCSICTFHNHPALDKCEQCEMPRIMLASDESETSSWTFVYMETQVTVDN